MSLKNHLFLHPDEFVNTALSICCSNPYDLNKKCDNVLPFNLPSVKHTGSIMAMNACSFISLSMSGGSFIFPYDMPYGMNIN